jgi:hypothetical protein
MVIWLWAQPMDRIWKVVTDSEKGMVKIYDEKYDVVFEKKNLEKTAVCLIEENFFEIVAEKVIFEDEPMKISQNGDDSVIIPVVNKYEYDSMYA